MVYFSISVGILMLLIFYRLGQLFKQQQDQTAAILGIANVMEKIANSNATTQKEVCDNLIRLCNGHNDFSAFVSTRMDFTAAGIQYVLLCMRPYLLSILDSAIKREDYEEAKECQKIIDQLTVMIQYQFDNQNKPQST